MGKNPKYTFALVLLAVSLVLNGYLYHENYQQSEKIIRLKQQTSDYSRKLETEKETYDLRNILDISARRFLKAMIDRDLETLKKYTAKYIQVDNMELVISIPQSKDQITYPYPAQISELRQRDYYFEQNTFTSGYEATDSNGSWLFIITFVKEGQDWKVQDVSNDI